MALVDFCVDGLRVGTLVELHSLDGDDLNGSLGQVVSYSDADGFGIMLINGTQVHMKSANVRVPKELKKPGLGGGPGSFDVLVGPRMDDNVLADEVAACLFEKGFCVMRVCQSFEETGKTFEAMKEMAEAGKLQRFAEEVEEGYLGTNNRGKVAWIDTADKDSPKDPLLDKNDAFISQLASLIQPYCADMLGKQIDERTPALMSLSLTDDEEPEYPPQDSDDASLGQFLSIWRRKIVQVVHFMGPESSQVVLESTGEGPATTLPFKQDSVEIEAEPNTILIFRPQAFNYECKCDSETLSLTAAFLEQTSQLTLFDWEGDAAFLFTGEGPPGPVGEQIEVANMATRLMCNYDEAGAYNAGLYGGCDAGVEIPYTRWDLEDYYNPDNDTLMPWQSPTKHQSMVEGVELFDNKFFEIILSEARVMDPMQRMVLETGSKNLFQMGITKKVSNRTPHHGGCSVGLDKDDWDRVPKCPEAEGGTNVQAIISNRFSFVFNLRGPNYVADTACSASLCATHLAKFTLMDRTIDKLEFHIAIGLHLCLHPSYFLGGKNNTMNSPIGRCLTFNATASGYMRGDGCSGITLKYGQHEDERDAVWRASMINQNGRSATLTAPNGLAQGDIIEKAITEARMSPTESVIWSCHGTGTSLGDPIEVGAVRRNQIKQERPTLLMVLTNKTHTGHLEGGAAMTSLIAATLMCKTLVGVPINHFRQLNPNLEQSAFDAFFNNEMGCTFYTCGNVHVSSFGFGGSNGHCILWGQSLYGIPDVPSALMRRLKKMAPPEVRVAGADPAEWEWDGPEKEIKPGDKYKIELDSTDQADAAIRWEKVADGADDDGEDDYYCITGPFNEWDTDRMEEGPITGMRTITLEVPSSGEVEFRFVKNGEEEEGCLFPPTEKCSRRTAPILGPDISRTERPKTKGTWLATAEPNDLLKVDLFICRGRKSVQWKSLGPEE